MLCFLVGARIAHSSTAHHHNTVQKSGRNLENRGAAHGHKHTKEVPVCDAVLLRGSVAFLLQLTEPAVAVEMLCLLFGVTVLLTHKGRCAPAAASSSICRESSVPRRHATRCRSSHRPAAGASARPWRLSGTTFGSRCRASDAAGAPSEPAGRWPAREERRRRDAAAAARARSTASCSAPRPCSHGVAAAEGQPHGTPIACALEGSL